MTFSNLQKYYCYLTSFLLYQTAHIKPAFQALDHNPRSESLRSSPKYSLDLLGPWGGLWYRPKTLDWYLLFALLPPIVGSRSGSIASRLQLVILHPRLKWMSVCPSFIRKISCRFPSLSIFKLRSRWQQTRHIMEQMEQMERHPPRSQMQCLSNQMRCQKALKKWKSWISTNSLIGQLLSTT